MKEGRGQKVFGAWDTCRFYERSRHKNPCWNVVDLWRSLTITGPRSTELLKRGKGHKVFGAWNTCRHYGRSRTKNTPPGVYEGVSKSFICRAGLNCTTKTLDITWSISFESFSDLNGIVQLMISLWLFFLYLKLKRGEYIWSFSDTLSGLRS